MNCSPRLDGVRGRGRSRPRVAGLDDLVRGGLVDRLLVACGARRRAARAARGSSRAARRPRRAGCGRLRRFLDGRLVGSGRLAGGRELPVGVERGDDAAPRSPCSVAPPASSSSSSRSSLPSRRSRRARRAAIEETTSGSRTPNETCLRSFSSGTVGLRSSGTVSTSSLSVTPTASTITKWSFAWRVGGDGLEGRCRR